MNTRWYGLRIQCNSSDKDLIIAELSLLDAIETFEEHDDGLTAYTEMELDIDFIKNKLVRYRIINLEWVEIQKINWNKAWEEAYEPIVVNEKCLVRASFHSPRPEFDYELVINPKMSFGTGHHATTYLMLNAQMDLPHEGRDVLDYGTGTGVLAVMAEKRGAQSILAIDKDPWCIENSMENFTLNGCNKTKAELADIVELRSPKTFGGILANINRNVLLGAMEEMHNRLKADGWLLISGILVEDLGQIQAAAERVGLSFQKSEGKNEWICAQFLRS